MTNYVQAIVTVLSLVNPAVCAKMFLKPLDDEVTLRRRVSTSFLARADEIVIVLARVMLPTHAPMLVVLIDAISECWRHEQALKNGAKALCSDRTAILGPPVLRRRN